MSHNLKSSKFSQTRKNIRLKNNVKYKRILLKMSGEHFAGEKGFGFDHKVFQQISKELKELHELGIEMAVVSGGGNIFRGVLAQDTINRSSADNIGMLATIMNGIYLQNTLENLNLDTRLMSAIGMPSVAETYIRRRAERHLEKGRIVILVAGTGNPFFTTDTAAVLRGREINADIVVKCTNVDGVYDKDPKTNVDAKKFNTLKFNKALTENLNVMDSTAFSFSYTHKLNIYVLDIKKRGNLVAFVTGKGCGTLVEV